MQLFFATTNAGKLKEASDILGVEVLPTPLDIPEIQSLDPIKVALHKAQSYYQQLNKPLLVEDVSLVFTSLKDLPGPYINDFSTSLGNVGLIKLLESYSDKSATAITTLVYCDSTGAPHIFQGILKGEIAPLPKGENGFGWDPIFIPQNHTLTLAKMSAEEKNSLSMRAQALKVFKSWLDSK